MRSLRLGSLCRTCPAYHELDVSVGPPQEYRAMSVTPRVSETTDAAFTVYEFLHDLERGLKK